MEGYLQLLFALVRKVHFTWLCKSCTSLQGILLRYLGHEASTVRQMACNVYHSLLCEDEQDAHLLTSICSSFCFADSDSWQIVEGKMMLLEVLCKHILRNACTHLLYAGYSKSPSSSFKKSPVHLETKSPSESLLQLNNKLRMKGSLLLKSKLVLHFLLDQFLETLPHLIFKKQYEIQRMILQLLPTVAEFGLLVNPTALVKFCVDHANEKRTCNMFRTLIIKSNSIMCYLANTDEANQLRSDILKAGIDDVHSTLHPLVYDHHIELGLCVFIYYEANYKLALDCLNSLCKHESQQLIEKCSDAFTKLLFKLKWKDSFLILDVIVKYKQEKQNITLQLLGVLQSFASAPLNWIATVNDAFASPTKHSSVHHEFDITFIQYYPRWKNAFLWVLQCIKNFKHEQRIIAGSLDILESLIRLWGYNELAQEAVSQISKLSKSKSFCICFTLVAKLATTSSFCELKPLSLSIPADAYDSEDDHILNNFHDDDNCLFSSSDESDDSISLLDGFCNNYSSYMREELPRHLLGII